MYSPAYEYANDIAVRWTSAVNKDLETFYEWSSQRKPLLNPSKTKAAGRQQRNRGYKKNTNW